MLDPQKAVVGISIGTEKIFLTQLKRVGEKLGIDKLVSADVAPGTIQNGLIADIKSFAQALKRIFIDNNIKARQVFAAISEADVIMQVVKIPKMAEAQMKEALKAEVDKFMLSADTAVIDYYPLDKERVSLIAIKKNIVTTLLAAIEKAGLNLVGIDIIPLAAWRALSPVNIDLPSKKGVILILVGSKNSDISVISEGMPSYSRSIDTTELAELAKEIKVTATYWEEQFPANPIEKMIVLGDTVKAKNFPAELLQESGTIEQGKPLGIKQADFSLSRSASIGLAMRGTNEKFPFDINLLPPEKFKKMELEKRFLISFVSVSAILFIFFIMNFAFSIIINSYEKKLEPIKQELAASTDVITEVEKINKERLQIINILNQKKNFVAQTESIFWPEILTDIKDYIPQQVQLTELSWKKRNVLVLRGESLSQDAVYKYLRLLPFSGCFHEPSLAVMQSGEKGGNSIFKFTIICPLIKEVKKKNEN